MWTIAEVIGSHRSEIVEMWTQSIRDRPSARALSPVELASSIPTYLTLLGREAPTLCARLSDEQREVIEHHLSSRLHSGFTFEEILAELTSLGRCVSLCIRGDSAAESPDMEGVFANLQLTTVELAKLFAKRLLDGEQELKRYTKLLNQVATSGTALHEEGAPLRKRFAEMLTIVKNAMRAQTAALLLLESKTDPLIVSTGTGGVDWELERYVRSGDAVMLTKRIGFAERTAFAVADSTAAEVDVTDALGGSGIHSLWRQSLCAHNALRGVVYVGFAERRSFTAAEARRLGSLGDTLTMHLENARLYATLHSKIDEAKRASERSERFSSGLLADLKEPLRAARVDARQLVDLPLDKGPASVAAKLAREVDSLHRTVDDLIDAHSIGAGGRFRLDLAEYDLGSLALGVVEELRGLYPDRFIVRADKAVRGVWDAAQIARALWHLIINALEHGDKDAPIFVLVGSGPMHAKLAVHNAGPAISMEKQSHLFKPYAPPRCSNGRHHHAWGIGLTLVWGCAEAHGGGVEVKSAPGKGTTFVMSIPHDARPYADR